MTVYGGPDIVTDGLVLHLDAANDKSYDPVVEDCSLVLNMEGSNGSTTFTDGSKYGHTVTANGNAQISTGNSRFGASSAYFDGNGDGLTVGVPNPSLFSFDGDFTVEGWVYFNALPTESASFFMSRGTGSISNSAFQFGYYVVTNILFYTCTIGSVDYNLSFSLPSAPSTGEWYHFAFIRNSGVIKAYWNGIQIGNDENVSGTTNAPSVTPTVGFRGGIYNDLYLNGYIDSLRVVKGKALYTENFTPPKKSFPEYKWGDLSGNGNNGSFFNGVSYGSSNYGVMSFDGVNDVVSLPISNNLRNTSYTISVFMNSNINIQNGTSERYFYYFKGTTTGSNRFGVLFGFSVNSTGNNGRLSLVIGNGGWNTYSTSQSSWTSNTWYNLTVTQSGSSYKFYVNGLLVNSGTAVTPVFSGMEFNNSGTFWNGKFTPLLVYNKALSASEVLHNYNSLKKRFGL